MSRDNTLRILECGDFFFGFALVAVDAVDGDEKFRFELYNISDESDAMHDNGVHVYIILDANCVSNVFVAFTNVEVDAIVVTVLIVDNAVITGRGN